MADMQDYTIPFANTGEKEDFSTTTDPSGKVSLEKGFTELYELKPEEGGLFILRKVFNKMMNLVTTDTVNWKTQTFPNWIDDKGDGLPFAYPKNAIVRATDGENYISLEANNTENPVGSTKWKNSNVENIADHNDLTGRSDNDCHPISAITGLQTIIDNLGASGIVLSDFTGTNQSKTTNGYQKLPGGLIIQWGSYTTSSGIASVTFPVSFPTVCQIVMANQLISGDTAGVDNTPCLSQAPSKTSFTMSQFTSRDRIYWFAIGY